jgi:RNase P subunit RPR2
MPRIRRKNPVSKKSATCDACGDDGSLYLHARCHMHSPTWAVLSGDVLTIECAECGKVVARFQVKELSGA